MLSRRADLAAADKLMWIRSLTLYSRLVIGAWLLLFLGVLLFNLTNDAAWSANWSSLAARFLLPALGAGACLCGLRLKRDTRLVIANTLLAATAALYIGEFMLARRLDAARSAGTRPDPRDKLTVIRDLRARSLSAYPVTRAANLLEADGTGQMRPILSARGRPFLPMASVPRATVVGCNELGQWLTYDTDRHGFNNPDDQWDASNPAIGMVGDSFTHGDCVPPDRNMAGLLRRRFGATLNLGVGGFGPLLELAALKEYLEPVRPHIVLWVFFEGNDLTYDLPLEARAPMLRAYLDDPAFSQDLIHRDGDVAHALRDYVERNMQAAVARMDLPWVQLLRWVSLDRMREAIGLGALQIGYNTGDTQAELALFARILAQARQRVEGWGGTLYLVYIPESDRYLSRFGSSAMREAIHDGVARIARQARIPVIDIASAFAAQPAPGTLYAFPGGHFNEAGYRHAASAIATALERNAPAP